MAKKILWEMAPRSGVRTAFLAAALALCATPMFGQSTEGELNKRKPVVTDRDLVIQKAEVTENALFYPVDIEGTRLEVIAVKAPDGSIRTAFNTCEMCFNSGKGYYTQEGAALVCQKCGKRFLMSEVEISTDGGCNPVPIFPQDKKVSDSTITIPKKVLKAAKKKFDSWRKAKDD